MKTDYQRIFSNATSLFILQLITYAISLAAVPYLVRILGPSKYGLVIFAQSIITYFIFLVDYGFDIWGTMKVAENQSDKAYLSEIFHNVMATKVLLGVFGFVLTFVIVFSIEKLRLEWRLIFLTYGMIIGQVLIPSWFFRGVEKMKFIAFCLIFVKALYLVLIFMFVKSDADYMFVPIANFIAYNIAGVLGLFTIYYSFKLSFVFPSVSGIIKGLKEGFAYFAKALTDNFAKITNTVILGLIAGDAAVGFYGSAEKLMDAVRAMISPVFQAIFPHVRKLASNSKKDWFQFMKKLVPLVIIFSALLSLSIFIFAGFGVRLVLGDKFEASIAVLKILSVYLFFFTINNIMGVQTLVCFDRGKAFLSLTLLAKSLGVLFSLLFIKFFYVNGAAAALVFTEAAYSFFLFIYIIKSGLFSDLRRGTN